MRDVHVVFVLPDLPLSGTATRTVHLAKELAAGGDHVTVAVLVDHVAPSLAEELAASGIDTLVQSRRCDRRRLAAALRGRGPVVVHAAMPTAGVAGMALARVLRRPLVYSVTNSLHADRPLRRETPQDRLKIVLESVLVRRADVVHAVSASVAEQVTRRIGADRVCVAVHPPTPAPGRPRPVADLPPGAPRLLTVSRMLQHKRVLDAVVAVAVLRGRWPQVRLVVVGDGPGRNQLEAEIDRRGLAEHVALVGAVADPATWFGWADVLVHPSIVEGYPRVVGEALLAGVPVVCVRTAHTPAGSHVVLARPFDPRSLAAGVVEAVGCGPMEPVTAVPVAEAFREIYRRGAQVATGRRIRIRHARHWWRRPDNGKRWR